ncbi:MAG: hypothetical protein KDK90_13060, partial [Leptospiraceae bacterium]|nr:hypothetical protein [Leptospiraceae bacterium]
STAVSETGATSDTYTIKLDTIPTSAVNIAIAFDTTQVTVNGSGTSPVNVSLSDMTASTVTIAAIDDSVDEADPHTTSLTYTVTSSDGNYSTKTIASTSVSITDNDTAGLNISGLSGTVSEAGSTATYTISLTTKPLSDVIVNFVYDTAQLVLKVASAVVTSITFTDTNWGTPQTITVEAVNDDIAETNPHNPTIQHKTTSSDPNYESSGASLFDLLISIVDNDTAGVTASSSSLSLTEGGTAGSYTLVLTSQPTNDVTISIAFDTTQLKLNGSSTSPIIFTFTSANWNTTQNITVDALCDGLTEGSHTKSITHTVSSSDSNYSSLSAFNVDINITDNTSCSRLKSAFQSGTDTMSSTTLTKSITQVDPTKSFVYCNFMYGNSGAEYATTCQLDGTGSNVILKTNNNTTNTTVNWYVVEFATGATVQRGSYNMSSGTTTHNQSITAVTTSKTFVIAYTRMNNSSATIDERRTVMAQLTSATNLELSRNESGTAVDIEWQVIQLDGANVQSGQMTLNSSTGTATITTVDLASSFLLFNYKAASAVNGDEIKYYTRGTLTDSTTVTFNRKSNTNSVDVSWFVITMTDGTKVQKGTKNVTTTDVTVTDTVTSVNTGTTMIALSNDIDTGDASTTTQDSGTFSSKFNSSTQIEFGRYKQESNAGTIDWFTVEFLSN